MATLVTFFLPEYFVSTTRIKIGSDQPDIRSLFEQTSGTNVVDSVFLQTELETILSEVILNRVIDDFHLNDVWGRKYFEGGKLKTSESLALLRGRLDIRPVRNTSLLDIRAYSENPNEARDIANGVVKAYHQWRSTQLMERVRNSLKSLDKRVQLMDETISQAKRRLEAQAGALPGTQNPAYSEKQRELEETIALRSELTRRMRLEEIDAHLPRSGQVTILETAKASTVPFRPNKPLNIILGIVIGAAAGFLLAVLVYVIRCRAHQRLPREPLSHNLRGLRTCVQVSIALLVGALVGYNCAMPLSRVSLSLMFLFVIFGGLAIGYVTTARTTPLPGKADGTQMTV